MDSVFRSDVFAGKKLLITGGATGIGRGISEGFAHHGAEVTIVSRSEERLAAACKEIGNGAQYRTADVRDAERAAELADELGPQDILINCAAGNFPSPFSALSENAWKSVMDIVLGGTVNYTRTFGQAMHDAGASGSDDPAGRSIINIVAGYAWTGAPGVAHSGAAKAAVLNLTKSLAVEWAPNVRSNAVSPGPIGGTEGMQRLGEDLGLADAVNASVPLGRHGDPQDIAEACMYLASPAGKYVNGACLVVDGGQDALGPFGPLFTGLLQG